MALCNWDTLAINETGASANGVLVSPLGVKVLIYKNWVYVQDESAWSEGCPYMKPYVMEVHAGHLTYKDTTIVAVRGPQNGVFAYVSCGSKVMLGCGVYGYQGKKWVGVTGKSALALRKLAERHSLANIDLDNVLSLNQGDARIAKEFGTEVPARGITPSVTC